MIPMLGEGGKEGSLCGCRILGIPSAGRTLSEAPGCFWELGRPAGLFNLIQREQEGLASELGWNFVQFLHEFRMVLGRAFRGHPIQFPTIIRDTFTRSGFSEPHPTLSTFSLVRKEFSLFPLQIQASIHIAPTSRAALPCHEEFKLEPQHLPPHLARIFPVPAFRLQQEKYQASRLLWSRQNSVGNARTSINPEAPALPRSREQLPSRIPSPAPLSFSTTPFPASEMEGKEGTLPSYPVFQGSKTHQHKGGVEFHIQNL